MSIAKFNTDEAKENNFRKLEDKAEPKLPVKVKKPIPKPRKQIPAEEI